jgi:hypothetical protein
MADLMKNQIEAFKERGLNERQRFTSEKGAEALTTGAKIRGEAVVEASKIHAHEAAITAAASMKSKSLKLTEYAVTKKTDNEGNEVLYMFNKNKGHKTVRPIGELGVEAMAGFFEKAGTGGAGLSAEWLDRLYQSDPEFAKQIMSHISVNDPETAIAISEFAHSKRQKKE